MKKSFFLLLMACLTPVFMMAQVRGHMLPKEEQQDESSCYYYIVCMDQYGDGWNGAEVYTLNNLIEYSDGSYWYYRSWAQLKDGMLGRYVVEYDGDPDKFYWISGGYDSECYFFIANQNKVGLFTKPLNHQYADSALMYTMSTSPCSSTRSYNLGINHSIDHGVIHLSWNAISGAHHYKVIISNYTEEPDSYQYQYHSWARYCLTDESFENTTNTYLDFLAERDANYDCMVLACNASDEVICFDYVLLEYTGTPIGEINLYFRPDEGVDFLTESGRMWVFYDNDQQSWVQEAILQEDGWYLLNVSNVTHNYFSFRALNTHTNDLNLEGTGIKYTQIMCDIDVDSHWLIGNPVDDDGYTLTPCVVAEGPTNLKTWDVGNGKYLFTWDPDPLATRYFLMVTSKNINPYSNKMDTVVCCIVEDGLQSSVPYPILRADTYEWVVCSLNENDDVLAIVQGGDFSVSGTEFVPQINYGFNSANQLVFSWATAAPNAWFMCYDELTGNPYFIEEVESTGSRTIPLNKDDHLVLLAQSSMRSACLGENIDLSYMYEKRVDLSTLYCHLSYDDPVHGNLRTDGSTTESYYKPDNKQVHFTVTPKEHYYIYAWKVDGQLYPVSQAEREGSALTITMDRDHHVSVIIKEKDKFRVLVYSSPAYYTDASITPERADHYYYKDEVISISTNRNGRTGSENYYFDHWDNAPSNCTRSQSFTWTVTGAKTMTAKWNQYSTTRVPITPIKPGNNDQRYTVTVNVSPVGAGVAAPDKESYTYNERAVITAQETNPDYEFDHWRETGQKTKEFEVNVRQNLVYTAVFKHKQEEPKTYYCVQIKVDDNGGGSVLSKDDPEKLLDAAYEKGTQLKIQAKPNPGYDFIGWSDGVSTNPRTITVNDNKTYCPLEASFKRQDDMDVYRFRLTCSPKEAGELEAVHPTNKQPMSVNTTYTQGTRIKVTVKEHDGWRFTKWSDNSTDRVRTFTVRNDIVLTALYEPIVPEEPTELFTLSLIANDGGMVNAEVMGQYPAGAQVEIIATPMESFAFSHWSDQLGDTLHELRIKDTITILSDTTIIAHFMDSIVYAEYFLDLHLTDGGTIRNINEIDGLHAAGDMVDLEALPFDGYTFVGWSDGIINSERTVIMDRDYSLTAYFRRLQEYLFSYFINDTLLGYIEAYEDINDDILDKDTFLYEGTPISLYAEPYELYSFHSWRANEHVLSQEKEWQFILSQDTVITAYFVPYPEAIQHVHVCQLDVRVIGKDITVHAPEATDIYVVSASGQMVTSAKNTNIATFHVPTTGLYVIRTKSDAAKIVVR